MMPAIPGGWGGSAAVTGMAAALPSRMRQSELWDGFFDRHYAGSPLARRAWKLSGVESRYGVADPRVEDVSGWGTQARMQRFLAEALPLGKEAIAACLARSGIDTADVGLLSVVSCTGYATPGLDVLLARDLGMSAAVQRLHVGHMGCYAALPGMAAVADAAVARGKLGVLLCLELTSLHIQPPTDEVDQMVAHALFSDAAAAAVIAPGSSGLELVDLVAHTDAGHADLMTWDVTDLGFRMGLSPRVPRVLAASVADVTGALLAAHGLATDDVAKWAVHPGGPRIVDVVGDRLGLTEEQLEPSRRVLRDYGNCSSATVLLVLEEIRRQEDLRAGDHVVAMAFGPGLTLYVALLRQKAPVARTAGR